MTTKDRFQEAYQERYNAFCKYADARKELAKAKRKKDSEEIRRLISECNVLAELENIAFNKLIQIAKEEGIVL